MKKMINWFRSIFKKILQLPSKIRSAINNLFWIISDWPFWYNPWLKALFFLALLFGYSYLVYIIKNEAVRFFLVIVGILDALIIQDMLREDFKREHLFPLAFFSLFIIILTVIILLMVMILLSPIVSVIMWY